jgi:hypothetical protein
VVDDAPSRGHRLLVAGRNGAAISQTVSVFDGPGKHIRDRLDPAVRVPRESRQVILRNVIAKIIEQQERIEIRRVAKPKSAAEMHARAFARRFRTDQLLHRSQGHSRLPD